MLSLGTSTAVDVKRVAEVEPEGYVLAALRPGKWTLNAQTRSGRGTRVTVEVSVGDRQKKVDIDFGGE